MKKIIPIIRERTQYIGDFKKMIEDGDLDYYFTQPEIDIEKIIWKKDTKDGTIKHLEKSYEILSQVSGNFNAETTKNAIWEYAEEVGKGNVLWPLRYALSGKDKSPDPFTLLETLGKEVSLERISFALNKLSL
jgi:glutamyl/glutaminyl-tRNA synthetase